MQAPLIIGYWNIRGFAQPIKLLLSYVGREFETKQYCLGPAPTYSNKAWKSVKYSLGLPFPNLPYLIDGDVKIVQSHAILKYFGRQHNLCGTTEEERIRMDIMEHQLEDTLNAHISVCYSTYFGHGKHEDRKAEYLKHLPYTLRQYSEFLADHPWFAGENITFVDFIAYDLFDIHRVFSPGCLDGYKNIADYMEKFEELPAIEKYMHSGKFLRRPIYNKPADWRGD
ncbi:glutathione S-transferase Mu 1 [Lingula anatina]|uniref:glutathione transferase n=1 Tax=Lingula anatina TaxID=7574 RepID=A0A1S3IQV2_LINAN|nr:glutathione S-transferase Mu 1 [Lingula anatina]|eukprot:XP_013400595.1 glutathione S-transferase Mu 1 [Lingula anatina]